MEDPSPRVYLDYNATAPLLTEVVCALKDALRLTGNPSSVHEEGRRVRALVEDARDSIAALVGNHPEKITFTSGGTEANLLAIEGLRQSGAVKRVLASSIEHPSVLEHIHMEDRLPVKKDGTVDLGALERALSDTDGPALVSVMFANNETGIVQPWQDIAAMSHEHGGYFHCDAVQAPGKSHVDLCDVDADILTVSAHKIGGPQGVGALVAMGSVDIEPIFVGGGQERGRRAGTENSLGIVGFGIAAKTMLEKRDIGQIDQLKSQMETAMLERRPDAVIFGHDMPRLANTTCVALPGTPFEKQVMALDLAGFAVSSGSACSSGKMAGSHVLAAMGVDASIAQSAVRVSIGSATRGEDLDRFVDCWATLDA